MSTVIAILAVWAVLSFSVVAVWVVCCKIARRRPQ
jgi:hypothetical protein